jgi:hypothetical protein
LGSFIVETMKLGAEAMPLKEAENGFVSVFDGGLFAIGDWFGMNRVAVVVVEKENIVIAADGRDGRLMRYFMEVG